MVEKEFEQRSRDSDESYRPLREGAPQFLERYLQNPITATHILSKYDPEDPAKVKLNAFIEEKIVDKEILETSAELRKVPPYRSQVSETLYGISHLIDEGKLMEVDYVEPGPPTERIVISFVIPDDLKKQYQQAGQELRRLLEEYSKTGNVTGPLLKIAWERYLLIIDKMLLRLKRVQEDKLVPENLRERWSDLGNLAWKRRGRRELMQEIVDEREAKIGKLERYVSVMPRGLPRMTSAPQL